MNERTELAPEAVGEELVQAADGDAIGLVAAEVGQTRRILSDQHPGADIRGVAQPRRRELSRDGRTGELEPADGAAWMSAVFAPEEIPRRRGAED
jgi:hypothetical protein